MINQNFIIVGAIIGILADILYAVQVLQGRVRPNRVSWFLWTLAPLIAFAAELGKHVGLQSLMTFSVGFGPLLVVIASFFARAEKWRLTIFDYMCAGLSLLALVLWAVTREGDVAIVFSIVADAAAGIPTLRKSFTNPETESWLPFLFGIVNSGLTLLTLKTWTVASAAFPVYICVFCVLIVVLVGLQPGKKRLSEAHA